MTRWTTVIFWRRILLRAVTCLWVTNTDSTQRFISPNTMSRSWTKPWPSLPLNPVPLRPLLLFLSLPSFRSVKSAYSWVPKLRTFYRFIQVSDTARYTPTQKLLSYSNPRVVIDILKQKQDTVIDSGRFGNLCVYVCELLLWRAKLTPKSSIFCDNAV
jgi:hypothetical protein